MVKPGCTFAGSQAEAKVIVVARDTSSLASLMVLVGGAKRKGRLVLQVWPGKQLVLVRRIVNLHCKDRGDEGLLACIYACIYGVKEYSDDHAWRNARLGSQLARADGIGRDSQSDALSQPRDMLGSGRHQNLYIHLMGTGNS